MKTRDRILDASRKLFNQHGVSQVTVEDISGKLEISKGNFWYHFRSKGLIVKELYQMMMGETAMLIEKIPRDHASILYFLETHRQLFSVQNKYKFFYLNLFEILRANPEVKALYLEYRKMGELLAKDLFQLYVEKGVLVEGISESQFDRLLNVGQMLDNSWAIDAEINFRGNLKQKMIFYLKICCGLLEPYLTPDAAAEYQQFFENLEAMKTVHVKS